tara:strand:- start:153 stop:920 length:768 start_codon:yes stop_codon:yes gene_type:complete
MRPIVARSGGKSKLVDIILPLIPDHKIYVEPFVGGGSIFFNKTASEKEVLNDFDTDLMNVYIDMKAVGDKITKMDFTPERKKFIRLRDQDKFKNSKDRLYRNLYVNLNSFRGNNRSFVSEKKVKEIEGSDRGKKYRDLFYFNRLKNTKLANKNYVDIIKQYDSPATFFYLDPPYSDITKNKEYDKDLRDFDLNEMYESLKNIKGKFLLSYDLKSKAQLKKLFNDKKYKFKVVSTRYETDKKAFEIKEILVMNYKI